MFLLCLSGFLPAVIWLCCSCSCCLGLRLASPGLELCLCFCNALGLLAFPLLVCCVFSALLRLCFVCGGALPAPRLSFGCALPGLCSVWVLHVCAASLFSLAVLMLKPGSVIFCRQGFAVLCHCFACALVFTSMAPWSLSLVCAALVLCLDFCLSVPWLCPDHPVPVLCVCATLQAVSYLCSLPHCSFCVCFCFAISGHDLFLCSGCAFGLLALPLLLYSFFLELLRLCPVCGSALPVLTLSFSLSSAVFGFFVPPLSPAPSLSSCVHLFVLLLCPLPFSSALALPLCLPVFVFAFSALKLIAC